MEYSVMWMKILCFRPTPPIPLATTIERLPPIEHCIHFDEANKRQLNISTSENTYLHLFQLSHSLNPCLQYIRANKQFIHFNSFFLSLSSLFLSLSLSLTNFSIFLTFSPLFIHSHHFEWFAHYFYLAFHLPFTFPCHSHLCVLF